METPKEWSEFADEMKQVFDTLCTLSDELINVRVLYVRCGKISTKLSCYQEIKLIQNKLNIKPKPTMA